MKLQILIPQYHETEEVIFPLLNSIAMQQGVDFNDIGVIITSDGGEYLLSESFLAQFPYQIQYYSMDHLGVSAARQVCLDNATAEYVMFCDADDMFLSVCGLWLIFHEMGEGGGFDLMSSMFAEETRDENHNPVYIYRQIDDTFIHGKTFNRQFLIDNDVKWNPSLLVHEDSYFCAVAQNVITDKTRERLCETPFYLWRWRDDSVSRTDPKKYVMGTFPDMLKSNTALVNELLRRGLRDKACYYCVYQVFDTYYSLNMDYWYKKENKHYKDDAERRFKQYYKDFQKLFYSMSQSERNNLSTEIRTKKMDEGMTMEIITFDDWIKHVMSIR